MKLHSKSLFGYGVLLFHLLLGPLELINFLFCALEFGTATVCEVHERIVLLFQHVDMAVERMLLSVALLPRVIDSVGEIEIVSLKLLDSAFLLVHGRLKCNLLLLKLLLDFQCF